jgi:Uma2 family endonuclease
VSDFVPRARPTTQAAEGLPRWRWTVSEIERMAADGYFHEDDWLELVGGDIVPMSPKRGRRHEIIRGMLAFRFVRATPESLIVGSVLPDVLIHHAAVKVPDVRGTDALLVVEVAKASIAYDREARRYASDGVREYWVINAATLDRATRSGGGRQHGR